MALDKDHPQSQQFEAGGRVGSRQSDLPRQGPTGSLETLRFLVLATSVENLEISWKPLGDV